MATLPLFRRTTITWRLAIWSWGPFCFFSQDFALAHRLKKPPSSTGPNPRVTIHLPIVFDRDLTARIHILFALMDETINILEPSIHEQDVTYRLDRLPEGTFLVLAQLKHAAIANPKRDFEISLEIANTVRPLDLSRLDQ